MYSTSSSECECNYEYCTCNAGYGNQDGYRTPFYATMGNPLIYYAQVPPPSKRQRSREYRKDNQNCFAKAFKWYTQEHVPQELSHNRMEINAFATWLDTKYDEFLRDSQLDNVYHIKMKRTSIIEADKIPNNSCCEPRSKRFRVKSPWRRKRRINSKEAGDAIQKPNQSFHFILKPKELTRVASECQPSTTTMVSNVIPIKTTIKSQSYTLVTYEPEKTTSDTKLDKSDELKAAVDERTSRSEPQNISCQCSMVKVEKTNAQSQYDSTVERPGEMTCDNQMLPRTKICCCICQPCKNLISTPNNDVPKAVTTKVQAKVSADEYTTNCQCSKEINSKADSQSQHQTHHMECEPCLLNTQSSSKLVDTCLCESEEVLKVENPITLSYPITFSNDSAQTSDHSIHFGNDTTHGYPLFMKIICADKLCK